MASAVVAELPAGDVKATSTVIAGVTLNYTSIEDGLKALNMTQEDFEAIMAADGTRWKHSGCQDGWKLSHDAIRRDMDALLSGLERTRALVESGRALEAWQVAHMQLLVKDMYHNVHAHHDHEEEIFFPWMESRVVVPPKMSSDHKTLMALLDRTRDLAAAMRPGSAQGCKSLVSDLLSTFSTLRAHMRQHLEEEEIVGLPLMRKHFTAAELEVCEKKIVADLKPSDMAFFLRPMDMPTKRATMTRFGIPRLVQTLVLLPAVRRDARTVMHAYAELAVGEQLQRSKGARKGFLCFAA
ncbi:hypothetical protein HYH03_012183 [Edaphochlamys debaryana]|uniref:Hemerythrin-like domain-containing protein n=1 Tax=Edaphochlamys debaryana TaxID=47281 RepID=A0A835XUP9_9CHLO|nr:hypothetical protein HYH03_012183 [Edaphochlamys debaryana]|eukprot:KAG2489353.1 hypothetical protein HYH03_012183 [Edaphochlamys debaryana]